MERPQSAALATTAAAGAGGSRQQAAPASSEWQALQASTSACLALSNTPNADRVGLGHSSGTQAMATQPHMVAVLPPPLPPSQQQQQGESAAEPEIAEYYRQWETSLAVGGCSCGGAAGDPLVAAAADNPMLQGAVMVGPPVDRATVPAALQHQQERGPLTRCASLLCSESSLSLELAFQGAGSAAGTLPPPAAAATVDELLQMVPEAAIGHSGGSSVALPSGDLDGRLCMQPLAPLSQAAADGFAAAFSAATTAAASTVAAASGFCGWVGPVAGALTPSSAAAGLGTAPGSAGSAPLLQAASQASVPMLLSATGNSALPAAPLPPVVLPRSLSTTTGMAGCRQAPLAGCIISEALQQHQQQIQQAQQAQPQPTSPPLLSPVATPFSRATTSGAPASASGAGAGPRSFSSPGLLGSLRSPLTGSLGMLSPLAFIGSPLAGAFARPASGGASSGSGGCGGLWHGGSWSALDNLYSKMQSQDLAPYLDDWPSSSAAIKPATGTAALPLPMAPPPVVPLPLLPSTALGASPTGLSSSQPANAGVVAMLCSPPQVPVAEVLSPPPQLLAAGAPAAATPLVAAQAASGWPQVLVHPAYALLQVPGSPCRQLLVPIQQAIPFEGKFLPPPQPAQVQLQQLQQQQQAVPPARFQQQVQQQKRGKGQEGGLPNPSLAKKQRGKEQEATRSRGSSRPARQQPQLKAQQQVKKNADEEQLPQQTQKEKEAKPASRRKQPQDKPPPPPKRQNSATVAPAVVTASGANGSRARVLPPSGGSAGSAPSLRKRPRKPSQGKGATSEAWQLAASTASTAADMAALTSSAVQDHEAAAAAATVTAPAATVAAPNNAARPAPEAMAGAEVGADAFAQHVAAEAGVGAGLRSALQLRTCGTALETLQPTYVTFQLPTTSYGGVAGTCPVRCRFLFQKALSPSDASNLGRIVMPRCSAAHLPETNGIEGTTVEVQDTQGRQYSWRLKYWSSGEGPKRTYLFEQCRDFQEAWQVQPRSTLAFYQMPSGALLVNPCPLQSHFADE